MIFDGPASVKVKWFVGIEFPFIIDPQQRCTSVIISEHGDACDNVSVVAYSVMVEILGGFE